MRAPDDITEPAGGLGRGVTPAKRGVLSIADLFCGAGGTTEGVIHAALGCGFEPRVTAINHWPVAVATHTANHPEARHLCTGVDRVNPRELFKPGELKLLWASPECTHHSVARGGKPINDQSRATAWCVVRFADALLPPMILVENVPEFTGWGPTDRRRGGKAIASRKGAIFRAWVAALEALGYKVEWRILCAADYGDPTTRRRLFVQAVLGRRKITWPEPTHSPAGADGKPQWRAAREIIDFALPAPSIYERERPLSEKTMARIYAGLRKFGLKPFIVPNFGERETQGPRTHGLSDPLSAVTASGAGNLVEPFILPPEGVHCGNRSRSIGEPLQTVLASRGAGHVVQPFIVAWDNQSTVNGAWSADKPLTTVTTKARHGVAQPFLVQVAHGNGADKNGNDRRSRSTRDPMPTVCGTRGEWALCDPALLPQQSDGRLRPVSEPVPTVAAAGAIALVEPFLVKYYGTGGASSIADPLDTVTTKDRHGLVRPVVMIDGERYLLDIGFRMLQPHELAGAQGFPASYRFTGTKTDQVKQIGNAVPCGLARALAAAVLGAHAAASVTSGERRRQKGKG